MIVIVMANTVVLMVVTEHLLQVAEYWFHAMFFHFYYGCGF